ncbi:hypothetical protein [Bradyrhizobium sp. HKCCYLR20261]|uniref:hypothetical protein n=1 Tax=Bradyrhizobium sp. HKCCYLR20261 TaxID=3420760 RepID=UPI003EB7E5E4
MLRAGLALVLLAVLAASAGNAWLGLASRNLVALPARGSVPSDALAVLDAAPDAAATARAADAALTAASDDRAGLVFRLEHAQQSIARALSTQPLQPGLWLRRVALLQRAEAEDGGIAESMKMVYFTSSASGTIAGERLRVATRLKKLDDRELADLIRTDVTMLLLQREGVRSTRLPAEISEAYRDGSNAGRTLLIGAVAETRPDLLPLLR